MASEGTKQDDLVQSPEEFIDKPKKGFMDLPPEIRDMVYKDLLKGTDWVTLIPISARSQVRTMVSRPMAENNIHTGIMYCSKTTNREATEFLYRKNTFYFSCPRGGPGDQNWRRVFAWLNKIGPANRSHLRDLRISQKSMEGFELVEDRSRVNRVVHGVSIFATQDPFRHYEELPYTLPATQGTVNSISPYVGKTLDLFGEDHWSKLKITTYTDKYNWDGDNSILTVDGRPQDMSGGEFGRSGTTSLLEDAMVSGRRPLVWVTWEELERLIAAQPHQGFHS